MLLTDLREAKSILDIDQNDTSQDKNLNFYVEWASSLIEDFLNRPGLSWKSRTEYYSGSGTQKLLLRSRPVFTSPAIQVWVDDAGFFGSASGSFDTNTTALTYGDHFALQIDTDEGYSKSGILVRINEVWNKPQVRSRGLLSPFIGDGHGNIKITYTAGYTVDTLPPPFRAACNLLVSRLAYLFPLGMELTSESYEERSIGIAGERKDYLLSLVKPLLFRYRNWKF